MDIKPQTLRDELVNTYQIIYIHLCKYFKHDQIEYYAIPYQEEALFHILRVKPYEGFNQNLLVTCGISNHVGTIHGTDTTTTRTELMLVLPPDWNFEDLSQAEQVWPLEELKTIAFYSMHNKVALYPTLSCGKSTELMPKFSGFLMMPSILFKPEVTTIEIPDEQAIKLLTMIPLYEEELAYKQTHALNDVIFKLNAFKVSEEVDLSRDNFAV